MDKHSDKSGPFKTRDLSAKEIAQLKERSILLKSIGVEAL